MGAMLIKETPDDLRNWLKEEARYNRRSLNQQVIVCLDWCMRTFGDAQMRDPFAVIGSERTYVSGKQLAARLESLPHIDDATARQMKKDANASRKRRAREFDYACFA